MTFTAWRAFTPGLASRQVLKQAAFVRDLEVQTLPSSFYVISDGKGSHGFWNQTPETTSLVARNVSTSKHVAKAVLERAGIRVPAGDVFPRDDIESAGRFAESIGVPVVVKPTAKSGGAGVTSEIATEEHFRLAWTTAQAVSARGRIIVERHVHGKDFRLYVVGDRVVATTHRVPAYVEGDGQSSVAELVEGKNKMRRANPDDGFKPIKLTPPIMRNLTEMGLTPDSVLILGRRVTLHPIANIGAGGESVDVSEAVHPDFREIAVRARKALPGAASGGVDLLVEDLSAPARTQDWAVCELNTSPESPCITSRSWGPSRCRGDPDRASLSGQATLRARGPARSSRRDTRRRDGQGFSTMDLAPRPPPRTHRLGPKPRRQGRRGRLPRRTARGRGHPAAVPRRVCEDGGRARRGRALAEGVQPTTCRTSRFVPDPRCRTGQSSSERSLRSAR